MAAKSFTRKRLFVDPKVQGTLILRVVLYWIVFLVTLTLMLLCWRVFTGPARPFYTHFDDMWFQFGPALVGSCLLLPLVVFDILRLSNRFAGPLFRLRRSLRALARGEIVRPISFREGDFWIEVAHEFNAALARLQHETPTPPEGNGRPEQDQEPVGAAAPEA